MSQHSVIAAVVVYFALACAALGCVFLPGVRAAMRLAWQRGLTGSRRTVRALAGWKSRRGRHVGMLLHDGLRPALRRHAIPAALVLAVVTAVPLAVLALRGVVRVESYDHTVSRAVDTRVAALLQGEQLVPPAPLPPELFTAPAVEQARPLVRFASREWALLDADFRQRLLVVFQLLGERGYEAVLLEGFRSAERQAQLAQLGPGVTLAAPGQSYHQYGLAADVAFLRDGRIVVSERDPWALTGYERLGDAAAGAGLTWGGGWRGLRDYGHVELRRPGVLPRRGDDALPTH